MQAASGTPPPPGACRDRLALELLGQTTHGDPSHPEFQPSSPRLCSTDAARRAGGALW